MVEFVFVFFKTCEQGTLFSEVFTVILYPVKTVARALCKV